MPGRADGGSAAAMVPDALGGRAVARVPRGELWIAPDVLAGAGLPRSPQGLVELARRLGTDLSFLSCTGPLGLGDDPAALHDAVAVVHEGGQACGAVVDGPWQRLTGHAGLESALRLTTDATLGQRLADLARETEREVDGWTLAGADLIVLADDVAHTGGPLFSPALFERELVPHYRRLLDGAGPRSPGHGRQRPLLGFHSDGDLSRLLPALVRAGFACFSLEPEATAPAEVWRRFGRRVTLLTGIPAAWLTRFVDWSQVAPALAELTRGGSLILASTCGVFERRGLENLATIYRLTDDAAASGGANAAAGRRPATGAP